MRCVWEALLGILPPRLRNKVDEQGREEAQELRLRLGHAPELVLAGKSLLLPGSSSREELDYIVNAASRYSPWAAATAAQGYLTAPGGHRIGLCGQAVCRDGQVQGIRELTSLCIRIARDFPGIAREAGILPGSLLILGAPGWGKTTLLRDVLRERSRREAVCVVDERGEIFPQGFDRGARTDVLTGCPKTQGILMALRTMSPRCIGVDEITKAEDCQAILEAANCGVHLVATIHGESPERFRRRAMYRELCGVFDHLVVLHPDKSWNRERMAL